MIVNFEFLDEEPIENVITCLNFKVDKVYYLGYNEVIQRNQKRTTDFLKKYCDVSEVAYQILSQKDLDSVLKAMRTTIESELSQGNDLFFDITGGESMLLVAFGILSVEYKLPIHMYNIEKNKLFCLTKETGKRINEVAEERRIQLNLDMYIEMWGGVINYNHQKELKNSDDPEFEVDTENIWNISRRYKEEWNLFCDILRKKFEPDENLAIEVSFSEVSSMMKLQNSDLSTINEFTKILLELEKAGLIAGLDSKKKRYKFKFKNEAVRRCLWDGGSALELHVYRGIKRSSDDCKIGVHLDWDGVIQPEGKPDVINEIDILAIKGNIPMFVSCKSGKTKSTKTLHALYELAAVADRFGGKYAKRILVTTNDFNDANVERAIEMGIEVRRDL